VVRGHEQTPGPGGPQRGAAPLTRRPGDAGPDDRPELATDERFATHEARGRHQQEIEDIVADWARGQESGELSRLLTDAGVPVGQVYTVADIFADPLFAERDLLLPVPDEELGEIVMPGIVPKLSSTPGRVRWPGPLAVGAHNREVLGGLLGLGDDDIDRLSADGVI
jgi:formyl-CoA transferase